MDIYDIEILELIKQYIFYMDNLEKKNLDLATEFLEMASRLVYIKSVMLLPKHEEADMLTQELTGQLIEYQLIKEISKKLGEMYVGDDIFCKKQMEISVDLTYRKTHLPIEIYDALIAVIGKHQRRLPPDKKDFHNIVQRPIVSVRSRIMIILSNLYKNGSENFESFFSSCDDNSEKVATFLAMLELIKTKRVRVSTDSKTIYKVEGSKDIENLYIYDEIFDEDNKVGEY